MTTLKNRLNAYEQLLRLHQPVGISLLLWPTLSALWLATGGRPAMSLVIILVMGTLLMRSAGCAFNDWINRDCGNGDSNHHVTDARVGLLKQGVIAPWEALAVAAVLTLIAFCFVWFTTRIAIGIAALALVFALVFALALRQPFFKRFFSLPKAFLGVVFLFGIPIAFAAANNTVPWYAWALMGVNVFWVVACNIEYAMANLDKDLESGKRSSALILERYDVLATAACYGLYLAGMVGVGLWWRLGMAYWIALALAAVFAAGCLWFVRSREASRCLTVFLHQHGMVILIFVGIAVDYALRLHAWPMLGR
ncbi:MAG: UbiA family prenyltransferase, partial [Burkholderiales bacterium]|jgi:4-hydroxybenzoate polyprenyltransferase|nr:UbiA family prenyltransferase [Burkholderiales bacterium]